MFLPLWFFVCAAWIAKEIYVYEVALRAIQRMQGPQLAAQLAAIVTKGVTS